MNAAGKLNTTEEKSRLAVPLILTMILCAVITIMPDLAQAGSLPGSPLDDVYDTLSEWTTGSIGKTIMLAFIIVGIVAGIARQSLLAFAVGIGAGLGVYNAPLIVETVFTAVL